MNVFTLLRKKEKTQKEKDQEAYEEGSDWRYSRDKEVFDEFMEKRKIYVKERYKAKIPKPVAFSKVVEVEDVQVERKNINRPRFGR